MELWIEGFEGVYSVSTDGIVYSYKSGTRRALSPGIRKNGYAAVQLYRQGLKMQPFVHRLVAETFIPNPNKLPQVNHINGDKLDNRVENLEWCTAFDNTMHAAVSGLRNNDKAVLQYDLNGRLLNEYTSLKEAQIAVGHPNSNGICCCLTKSGKTAYGYVWKYK